MMLPSLQQDNDNTSSASNRSSRARRAAFAPSLKIIFVLALVCTVPLLVGFRSTFPQLELLLEIRERVLDNYVEPVDKAYMDEGAIRGLVVQTDPYNALLRAEDSYPFVPGEDEDGYIGFHVGVKDQTLTVISTDPNSAAAKAGLAAGDRIIEIMGVNTFERRFSTYEAEAMNFAPAGKTLTLNVFREGQEVFRDIQMVYTPYTPPASVRVEEIEPGTSWVKVWNFDADGVVDQVEAELKKLAADGRTERVVLDLRNASNGSIETGVALADLFIKDGTPLGFTRSHREKALATFTGGDGHDYSKLNPAILINGGTAEAAEVAAATLHKVGEYDLVGEPSFGKITSNKVLPFDDNGRRILILHATYYLPATTDPIHGVGLEPDKLIEGEPPALASLKDTEARQENAMSSFLNIIQGSNGTLSQSDEQLKEVVAYLNGETEPAKAAN